MKKKVAIQGLKGSFHHEAASLYFQDKLELIECETFNEVIKAVVDASADSGIMAIENSLAGCIIPNYNLIRNSEVDVIGEVGLRVRLNVLAAKGTRFGDIVEIHSHQMALRQCGSFFSDYPQLKIVEAFDTAGSAKKIALENLKNIGAIASPRAAEEYGLEIIKQGIEDHDLNYTRFLILRKEGTNGIENPERVEVYFQTGNDPGSLAKTLTIISGLGINLCKLQSHPVPSKNTLYGFFATLEIDEPAQLDDLKRILERLALAFEILGTYKRGETHG
ncbi:MAG: prephenate dehydratase domain-containing protein [Bacteroidota bacterium]